MLATFLSENGRHVAVVDADIQQSISDHRLMDLKAHPNVPLPWQIRSFISMSPEAVANALVNLKKLSCDIIIDCPGNIIDPNLKAIYTYADIALVPMHYDPDSLKATYRFIGTFKAKFGAKLFFVPNAISGVDDNRDNVKQLREKVRDLLKPHGELTARIKRTVVVSEYSTILSLTRYQRNAVKYAFEPIIKELEKGGVE
ncbi:MAG: ParA family protein [Clostridium sp.]|nr:ParA family protein [Clostridium sp.]